MTKLLRVTIALPFVLLTAPFGCQDQKTANRTADGSAAKVASMAQVSEINATDSFLDSNQSVALQDAAEQDATEQNTAEQDGTKNGRAQRDAAGNGFAGLWASSFGPMRLLVNGDQVQGSYQSDGKDSTIEGEIKEQRLIFRYTESESRGIGWFELTDSGNALNGKWRADGTKQWDNWKAERKLPVSDRLWLFVVEANWETDLEEPEYSFGTMLRDYFRMSTARHVEVRHRFFHDAVDLDRFCRQIKYLAEPVVLLISTHGTADGISVSGETIGADVLARSLDGANNLKLLHLSGCGMMASNFPQSIYNAMAAPPTFPISGYRTEVAWDASAIADFTFLSLIMIRKWDPEQAVVRAIAASPYLGDGPTPLSPFESLGLSILMPADDHTEAEASAHETSTLSR